jgi:aspartate racemase
MPTLGLIGGIASPSTVDYHRQLTSLYRARSADGSYPAVLINSIDAKGFLALLLSDDRTALSDYLLVELGRLARAGADFGIFASNTPHLVFDQVQRKSPIPLISIVEETAMVAEEQGHKTLGLLGAEITMAGGFYPAVFARRGMTVVVPEDDDRAYVNDRYFRELVEGTFLDETRVGICAVVERMRKRHRVDGVILGGTELPLLLRDCAIAVPVLDTTSIHVESAVSRLLTGT